MKILSLNLLHGGGRRLGRLADYFCDSDADAVVAGEFRSGPRGDALIERLRSAGFASFHVPPRTTDYTVLLATRRRTGRARLNAAPMDRHRIVAATLNGLTIAGVYFNQKKEKASLFDFLLSRPPELGDSVLVIGDMNTGLHRRDEPGATFDCSDRFGLLTARGYVDLWRRRHGQEARACSWLSRRGVEYRIDHAFGTEPVAARLVACDYDHATRGTISDHSALVVEFVP